MDIEDILKSSPKEFAQKIRKLRSNRAKLKQLQLQKIREINKEANYNILKNKQEILKLKDKNFIRNYGEIKIFVNRFEINNTKMFYDQGLSFKYAIRPLQYSRVLKNGRIKYYTKNAKCIVFRVSYLSSNPLEMRYFMT